MASRLILTIGSFFFLISLLTALFSRKLDLKFSNKSYISLIVIVILLLVTEIIAFLTYIYTDYDLISKILLKIHWFTGFGTFYILYIYLLSVLDKNNSNSLGEFIKTKKKYKIFTIMTIISVLAFILVPFKDMYKTNYDFIPGGPAYIVIGYIFVTLFMMIYEFHKNKSNKISYIVYIIIAVVAIAFTFQMMFRNIAFFGLGATIIVFALYFVTENPVIRLTKDIDNLQKSIERSRKAKGDFLSNMSHEIRSPMNAILGFSDTSSMSQNNFDKDRVLNDVNYIKSSCKNLLDIINNILDISKIETGDDTIELKDYSLRNLILDWVGVAQTRLESKNIKFNVEIDDNLPNMYNGDSTKIYQIVLNLLTNSIKYTEVGKIDLKVSGRVTGSDTAVLEFKVSDSGFGIKDEDKDKVFKKFQRLDDANENEIEGTGLGLVLTKRYAELMGGKLWFESEYRVGSKFYFEIPQRIVVNTPIGDINQTIEINESKKLKDFSNYRVIVVDDDMLSLKVTRRILEAYNLDIVTVSDAKECINAIKMDEHFDLILLDHIMNKMDGIEAFNIIKNLKVFCDIPPIIMLTANAIAGVKEMYLKEGFDGYLSKPIDINELDRLLNTYLK